MGNSSLKDKVIFITGGSRGIGLAIALSAARDGAKIVIAAKTTDPHPTLPGTIFTAAKEIETAGGVALPIKMDIRSDDEIQHAVNTAVQTFGGIDILVNNASAISLSGTLQTQMKRFDLMLDVNTRGTFAVSQACIPHLLKAKNPHILTLSPPLNVKAKWFKNHCAYTLSKYGMSLCVLGISAEFAESGLAVNALWPQTLIGTSALKIVGGPALERGARKPTIVADAAHWILTRDSRTCTGQFFIDEEILRKNGVQDFDAYAVDNSVPMIPDLFLD